VWCGGLNAVARPKCGGAAPCRSCLARLEMGHPPKITAPNPGRGLHDRRLRHCSSYSRCRYTPYKPQHQSRCTVSTSRRNKRSQISDFGAKCEGKKNLSFPSHRLPKLLLPRAWPLLAPYPVAPTKVLSVCASWRAGFANAFGTWTCQPQGAKFPPKHGKLAGLAAVAAVAQ
jgi:hypothetical protein